MVTPLRSAVSVPATRLHHERKKADLHYTNQPQKLTRLQSLELPFRTRLFYLEQTDKEGIAKQRPKADLAHHA